MNMNLNYVPDGSLIPRKGNYELGLNMVFVGSVSLKST